MNTTERKQATFALHKSEEKYRSLVENADVGIATIDRKGRFTYLNDTICTISGYSKDELINKPFIDFLQSSDKEKMIKLFSTALLKSKEKISYEFRFIHKNGNIVTCYMNPTIIKSEGKIKGFNAIIQDTTKQKKTTEVLHYAEECFSKVFHISPHAMTISRMADGMVLEVNDMWEKVFGYSRAESVGKNSVALGIWSAAKRQECIKQLQKTGVLFNFETDLRCKTGEIRQVTLSSGRLEIEGEQYLLTIIHDITERKKAEEELQESKRKFRAIFDNANDGFIIVDPKSRRFFNANRKMIEMLGYESEEEIKNLTVLEIHPEKDLPYILEEFEKHAKGEISRSEDLPVKRKDGSIFFASISSSPLTIGNKTYLSCIFRDVTERKLAAEVLRESEEKWRSTTENSSAHIMLLDLNGKILFINHTIPDLTKEEVYGKSVYNFIPEQFRKSVKECFERIKKSSQPDIYFTEFTGKDRSTRYFEAHAGPVLKAGKIVGFTVSSIDITERKRVEEEIKKERDFSKSIVDTAQAIVMVLDKEGKIDSFNPYMEELSGYKIDEVKGKDWFTTFLPECDYDQIRQLFKKSLNGIKTRGNVNPIITKDGREILIEWYDKTLKDKDEKIIGLLAIGQDVTERKRTEEALHKSEEKWHSLVNTLPDYISLLDRKGRFLFMNHYAKGFKEKNIIGSSVYQYLSTESKETFKKKIAECQNTGKIQTFEHTAMGDYGVMKEYEDYLVPILGKDKVTNTMVVSRDITKRKISEKEIKSLAKFPSEDPNPVLRITKDGTVTYSNKAGFQVLDSWKTKIGEKAPERWRNAIKKSFTPKNLKAEEEEVNNKIFSFVVSPVADEGYANLYARDITDRKRSEEALKESEEKLRSIVENSSEQIFMLDKDYRFLLINKAAAGLSKKSPQEMIGKSIFEIFPENTAAQFLKNIKNVFDTGNNLFIEEKMVVQNHELYNSTSLNPVKDGSGKVIAVTGIVRDLTEHKKAEEALLESQKRFQALTETTNDFVWEMDTNGVYTYCSPQIKVLWGYKPKDIIGKTPFDFIFPEDRVHAIKMFRTMSKSKSSFKGLETRSFDKKGRIVFLETSGVPFFDISGKLCGYRGISRDVTERKKTEEKEKKHLENQLFLSDAELTLTQLSIKGEIFDSIGKKLQMLTKNTFITVAMYDKTTNKFIVNKLFGYSKYLKTVLKILGRNPLGMTLNYEDEKWQKKFHRGKLEKISEEDFKSIVLPHLPRNSFLPINKIININEIYTISLVSKNRLFGIIFFAAYKGCNVENLEAIETFINHASLIIQLKDDEEKIRRQNAQLKKLNQIKTDFFNITSHELRTPVSAIKGYIQILLKQILGEINEAQKKGLDVVLRNTNRLDNLIQELLDISRLESGTMKFIVEKTNIEKLVKEIVENMQVFANQKRIKINIKLQKGIPDLMTDQERIKQVLMNLVNNAIKFSPEDSVINIYAKMKKDHVLFQVQDYGKGIPKNKQQKIFEKFYQVDSGEDRKFGGVGLGLSISKKIVNAHGGKIWVESVLNKGSSFKFLLPVKPIQDVEGRFEEAEIFRLEV
jgi:PAS domain S-box-containing protein